MDEPIPRIGRITFIVHLIVAICFGVGNILFTRTVGSIFGYPDAGEFITDVRVLGAAILGLGGVTSLYCALAKKWGQVVITVKGELAYLALQALIYVYSLIVGSGPVLANVMFLIISLALFVLFLLTWLGRPTRA